MEHVYIVSQLSWQGLSKIGCFFAWGIIYIVLIDIMHCENQQCA